MDCYVVYPAGYDAGADWNGAVIIVYDIYGLDPAFQNMRANADRLAANGLAVFVPDFFRGSGRMVTDPPFTRPAGEVVDRELLNAVVPYVQGKGADSIGMCGFCFGGACMMRVCGSGAFDACGLLHGGGTSPAAAAKSMVPLMLLQAGGDPPLEPIWSMLGRMASIQPRCVVRTYWDQNHGFAGAGGKRAADARLNDAAGTALGTTIEFFKRNLAKPAPLLLHVCESALGCTHSQWGVCFFCSGL